MRPGKSLAAIQYGEKDMITRDTTTTNASSHCPVCRARPIHPLFSGICEECWAEHSNYPSSPAVFRQAQEMPAAAWWELCWGD